VGAQLVPLSRSLGTAWARCQPCARGVSRLGGHGARAGDRTSAGTASRSQRRGQRATNAHVRL